MPVQMTLAARPQVMQCGKCERVQEAAATQWVRALPAVALRKAGSLQKAHQPSLESMLAAQVASGTAICAHDKVGSLVLHALVHVAAARGPCHAARLADVD